MIEPYILKQLEEIVNKVDLSVIPYEKGNSIRIKHMVIRKSKHGFLVYDCKEHKKLASLYSKTGAVAYAHSLIYNTGREKEIIELDNTIAKHHVDSLFFKHTLENSSSDVKREVAEHRLDISLAKTKAVKSKLMHYILI
jgi:hypothetical protein